MWTCADAVGGTDAADAGARPKLGWSPSLFMNAAGLTGMPTIRVPSFMKRSASFFDREAADAEVEAGGGIGSSRRASGRARRRASGDSFRTGSGSLPGGGSRTTSGDSLPDVVRTDSGSLPPSRRASLAEGTPGSSERELLDVHFRVQ